MMDVRAHRKQLGVVPSFKRVDTCAAEFEADTPYMYRWAHVPVPYRRCRMAVGLGGSPACAAMLVLGEGLHPGLGCGGPSKVTLSKAHHACIPHRIRYTATRALRRRRGRATSFCLAATGREKHMHISGGFRLTLDFPGQPPSSHPQHVRRQLRVRAHHRPQGAHPGRRAQPHRPGHRVRLLLLPRLLLAQVRRQTGGT